MKNIEYILVANKLLWRREEENLKHKTSANELILFHLHFEMRKIFLQFNFNTYTTRVFATSYVRKTFFSFFIFFLIKEISLIFIFFIPSSPQRRLRRREGTRKLHNVEYKRRIEKKNKKRWTYTESYRAFLLLAVSRRAFLKEELYTLHSKLFFSDFLFFEKHSYPQISFYFIILVLLHHHHHLFRFKEISKSEGFFV
jgi:hypothetical protein